MEEHYIAATLLPFSTNSGLNDAAWARGIGKTVRYPCITSLPISKGIFNLDCYIDIFCILLTFYSFHTLRKDPTAPSAICFYTSGEIVSSP